MVLKAVSAGIIINLHGYRQKQKCETERSHAREVETQRWRR